MGDLDTALLDQSAAATAEATIFGVGDHEMRNAVWERMRPAVDSPILTEVERGYARQVVDVLDAVDLGGDVRGAIGQMTFGALRWMALALEEWFFDGNLEARS
jgi:hypothetical protein